MNNTILSTQPLPDIVHTIPFDSFCKTNAIYSDRQLLHSFVASFVENYDHNVGLTADKWLEVWTHYNRWGREAMIAVEDAHDLVKTQADALI